MTDEDMHKLSRTCKLLGISPFDALGIKAGDRFTLKADGSALIFERIHGNPRIGRFKRLTPPHSVCILYFSAVTPEKPYELPKNT